jgi:hypothetical protein
VNGMCHEFIKIYDSSSYNEGVKGLRTQGINSVLEEWQLLPRICTNWYYMN